MKRIFLFTGIILAFAWNMVKAGDPVTGKNPAGTGEIVHLTNDTFKKLIFDYEKNKEWKYEGTRPAIVDFYADWCGPCRQLSPIVEELAREYSGKIIVYKVDTDKETTLTQSLGITSLPSLLFIPPKGKPQLSMGYLPKTTLVKAINEILLTNK